MKASAKAGRKSQHLPHVVLTGTGEERGRQMAALNRPFIRKLFKLYSKGLGKDFATQTYFKRHRAFMKKEFPSIFDEMISLGVSAGLNPDQAFYNTILAANVEKACSAFGIVSLRDGPMLLRTFDSCSNEEYQIYYKGRDISATQRGATPYQFTCITAITGMLLTAVNEKGLAVGAGSGEGKFTFGDSPETINLYWWLRIMAQYCADCADVKKLVAQYRFSGKGPLNVVAVDAKGNALGIEFASEKNIAFRRPTDGLILETNHFQDPGLARRSKKARPDFWRSPYYYNSYNRLQYVERYRKRLAAMKTHQEFIDFAFEENWGRLIQPTDANIGNWITSRADLVDLRAKTIRYHLFPVTAGDHAVVGL
jgi:hypothetical protein